MDTSKMADLVNWEIDEQAFEKLTEHARKHLYPFKWGDNQDIDLDVLGYVSNTPGIIYEISNVYNFSESEMSAWQHVFKGYGAHEVDLDLDTLNRSIVITVYFDPNNLAQKKTTSSVLYKIVGCINYIPNFIWFYGLLALWNPQRYMLQM